MSRFLSAHAYFKVFAARKRASLARQRRSKARRIPGVESLEQRALLANITASGVISSTPDGANYDYSITLSNSGIERCRGGYVLVRVDRCPQ